jgi:hypothetical protein
MGNIGTWRILRFFPEIVDFFWFFVVPKSLVASPLVIFGHHPCVISMVPLPGRQYYHMIVELRDCYVARLRFNVALLLRCKVA